MRGESLSGGFVEIGEVAGWIADAIGTEGEPLSGPMEAEHYASHIASMWEDAEPVLGAEPVSAIGYGVIERLHARGGAQALVVLRGLAAVAEQPIRDLAAGLSDDPAAWGPDAPAWLSSVGSGEVVGAALLRTRVRADGTTLLLDLAWPSGERGGLGVFCDHVLGGLAKHILVGPPIEESLEFICAEQPGFESESLPIADVAARIRAAIERTEGAADPPVGETYRPLRGFARAQLRGV